MNPSASSPPESIGWKRLLADAIRDPDQLCDRLELPDSFRRGARLAARSFPLLVPCGFVAKMRVGDPADPLLRQILPVVEENESADGFVVDAVGDLNAERATGFIQKYEGRALLLATRACAVHCRYCFRRSFPADHVPVGDQAFQPALAALAADSTINEVILSGGDPLTLTDERLGGLLDQIDRIEHVRRIRIHTRWPIVLPERVDRSLTSRLEARRSRIVVVIHANHPREIDSAVETAIDRLRATGAILLNQSVLLRGVNDDAETLIELSNRLIDVGVTPYYLHQLDRVVGAGHFEVDDAKALRLLAEMTARSSGYAVPKLVREIAGMSSKTPLVDSTLVPLALSPSY